jgi:hypothetical protein
VDIDKRKILRPSALLITVDPYLEDSVGSLPDKAIILGDLALEARKLRLGMRSAFYGQPGPGKGYMSVVRALIGYFLRLVHNLVIGKIHNKKSYSYLQQLLRFPEWLLFLYKLYISQIDD